MRAGGIGTTDGAKSPLGKGFGGIDVVASLSAITDALAACIFGLGAGGFSFAASTAAVAAACFLIAPDISSMLLSSRAMRPDSRFRNQRTDLRGQKLRVR